MPRFIDADCSDCALRIRDAFHMTVPERVYHICRDGNVREMEQVLLPRRRERTQWDEREAVVVFKDANGKVRYPGRNDAPTPKGYERVVMRSDREVSRFEREHKVLNEARHFDRGSGRGFDDDFKGSRYD
jgi:hypothetical protein